jgi:periplasmic divalent cation tolerance protein
MDEGKDATSPPSSLQDPCVVVLMTFASPEEAGRIGALLVEERLVACINLISNVRSLYFWDNALQDAPEVLAVAKTTADRLDAVVQPTHSYSVPEVIALPVFGGAAPYLEWVRTSVS